MAARVRAFVIGLVFGLVLCWSGMSSPEVIRKTLLFQSSYLFLFMFSAIAVAGIGTRLVTRNSRIKPLRERPERRHIVGAVIFGLGWGVSNACPGPVLTQVGQGIGWGVFTCVGVVTGIWLYHRRFAVDSLSDLRDGEGAAASAPAPAAVRG